MSRKQVSGFIKQNNWTLAGSWSRRCRSPIFVPETQIWPEFFLANAIKAGISHDESAKVMNAIHQALGRIINLCQEGKQNPNISVRLFVGQGKTRKLTHHGWGFFLVEHVQYDPAEANLVINYQIDAYAYPE